MSKVEKTLDELFIKQYYELQAEVQRTKEKYNSLLDTTQQLLDRLGSLVQVAPEFQAAFSDPLADRHLMIMFRSDLTFDSSFDDRATQRAVDYQTDKFRGEITAIKELKKL